MFILRRIVAGAEFAVYGVPFFVSGWFNDDPGHGGRDLLADRTETLGGRLVSAASVQSRE